MFNALHTFSNGTGGLALSGGGGANEIWGFDAYTLSLTPTVGTGTPTFTRASTATFIGSNGLIQSAAVNVPRFDYDPVTLALKGLLIEEQRTNLTRQTTDFTVAPWEATVGGQILNGWLSKIRLYNVRKSNAEIQAMTV